jgi:hypothetical protein
VTQAQMNRVTSLISEGWTVSMDNQDKPPGSPIRMTRDNEVAYVYPDGTVNEIQNVGREIKN